MIPKRGREKASEAREGNRRARKSIAIVDCAFRGGLGEGGGDDGDFLYWKERREMR